jgi:hypothetical protein
MGSDSLIFLGLAAGIEEVARIHYINQGFGTPCQEIANLFSKSATFLSAFRNNGAKILMIWEHCKSQSLEDAGPHLLLRL